MGPPIARETPSGFYRIVPSFPSVPLVDFQTVVISAVAEVDVFAKRCAMSCRRYEVDAFAN